jgi:hypothetical protein
MKIIITESKMVNLIERVLDMYYPDLSNCYYDWAEYNCGMGVCCDPYAVGFVLPDKEYYQYLFKLVDSSYYDDMGYYPKELSEDLPEGCYEPPNIDNIGFEFDTILVGEEMFELLNDHFNDPKIWWNQLLFVLNNRFSLNATKIGIGIF